MGAMVSLGVGRGDGKPQWDWGSGQECTPPGSQKGLDFSSLGSGTEAQFVAG